MLVVALIFWEFRIDDEAWKDVVASDGKGYYHYFLEYFVPSAQRDAVAEQNYLQELDGHYYTKYPLGVALLLAPFFAIAWVTAVVAGYPTDGLSFPFQLWTGIGALFYLLAGGIFLYRLLRTFNFSQGSAYGVTIITIFGTNLLYYGVMAGTMSHVYSFCGIAAFAYFVRKAGLEEGARHWLAAVLTLGVIVALRPFNGLVVLAVPALVKPDASTIRKILQPSTLRAIAIGGLAFFLLIALQLLSWHDQAGEWLFFSYPYEGFYFDQPRVLEVLFSWNKGLFIYTPIMLLCLIGILFWMREQRTNAAFFLLFMSVLVYFVSAWWCWNYASGFGLRPFIDFYALLAIPLAWLLNRAPGITARAGWILAVLFLALNMVQSYQYAQHILHHSSMDLEKYRYAFLKTDAAFENNLGGSADLPPYAPAGLKRIHSVQFADAGPDLITGPYHYTWTFPPSELPSAGYKLYWKVSMEKRELTRNGSAGALLVFDFASGDEKSFYATFPINATPQQPIGEWKVLEHTATTPCPKPEDTVKVYLWNAAGGTFELRDVHIELYKPCFSETCDQ